MTLHILENEHWQVGIVPETGAGVAFGRVRRDNEWVDLMRPTDPANYDNSSLLASFLLIPWSNRLREARFRFENRDYQLEANSPEGFAQHGVVRRVQWQVATLGATSLRLTYDSRDFAQVNFPFAFSAEVTYRLEGEQFVMDIHLTNEDSQPFPAGFGHHPYFVRDLGGHAPQVEIPAYKAYEMVNLLTVAEAQPIPPELDFRQLRPLEPEQRGAEFNHVLTGIDHSRPVRLVYGDLEAQMTFDPIYSHVVFFSPLEKPFYAVEPVTNTNDGFNLYAQGVPGTGVFVLQPGETQGGEITLRVVKS